MSDIINRADKVFIWIPDDDNLATEGKYHEVGKTWALKLFGAKLDFDVDYSWADKAQHLFIHDVAME